VTSSFRPTTRGENITLWLLGLAFCGTLAAGLVQQFVPQKLSVVFFIVLWGAMLVLHEAGHAVMARALGWRVGEMSIGFGPVLWRGHIGRTRVIWRLIPIEGYVLPAPASTRGARIRSALIYAAGPGAELLLLGLLIAWLGIDTVFNDSDKAALIALETLAIVIIWGAGFNLLPFRTGGGASDGLGILLSPFMTDDTIEQRMLALDELDAQRLANRGDIDGALERLDTLIGRGLQVERLRRKQIALLAEAGRYADARARLDQVLDGCELLELADVGLLHLQALVEIQAPGAATLNTDIALNRALRLAPDNVSLAITRGIANVRRKHSEEGGNQIAQAFRRADSSYDQARALGYLAVAAARCHDADAAARFLVAFEHINESEPLRRQVHAAMPENQAATGDRLPQRRRPLPRDQ
jgi:hypothetical protein